MRNIIALRDNLTAIGDLPFRRLQTIRVSNFRKGDKRAQDRVSLIGGKRLNFDRLAVFGAPCYKAGVNTQIAKADKSGRKRHLESERRGLLRKSGG